MVVWCDPNDDTVIYWTHKGIKCKPEDVCKADVDQLIRAYEAADGGEYIRVVRCKDCKHWHESAFFTGEQGQRLGQCDCTMSMRDTEFFCKAGEKKEDADFSDGVDLNIIFKQPEPKPNLFAKWICLGHRIGFLKHPYSVDWKCSNCGYESYWDTPSVCPNCRAKMDEVE